MKKGALGIFIGLLFSLASVASFFSSSFAVDYVFSKLNLSIAAIFAGGFLIYTGHDIENKSIKVYSVLLSSLVIILSILQLLSLTFPHIFLLAAPVLFYKILLLVASVSVVLLNLK